ncbi:hypothetical protein DV735_g2935, partial [Chaetothyriales sp. CBS 134920]
MAPTSVNSPTTPNQLLALGGLGFFLLWGAVFFNGTLDTLNLAQKTGVLPDNSPLRTTFTGWEVIDSSLSTVTAFLYVLTRSGPSSRWLLFDTSILARTITAWSLVDSRRRGVGHPWLRHQIGFWFLLNLGGVAFIAPLNFYLVARSQKAARDRTIPLNEARAFVPAILVNFLSTLLIFVPTVLNWPAHDVQGYIALFQLTPLFFTIAIVLFSRPGTSSTVAETPKDEKKPNVEVPWVLAAYYLSGTIASIAHLYTLFFVALNRGASPASSPELTVSRLFRPSPSKVFSALPGSSELLREGLHLFVQYDNIVAGIAAIVFVHYQLQNIPNKKGGPTWRGPEKTNPELFLLLVASAVLGPAAAGSFALAVREKRLRAELDKGK